MNKREFKVGDRVYSLVYGFGTVKGIDSKNEMAYPVCVGFDSGREEGFKKNGLYTTAHKNPTLFHANQGKVEFDTDEPIELVEDQPIWVRNSGCRKWTARHFARHAQDGGVYCYWSGQTKHSSGNEASALRWDFFRTTDPVLDGASQ